MPRQGPAQALAPRINSAFVKTAATAVVGAAPAEGVQAGHMRFNNVEQVIGFLSTIQK